METIVAGGGAAAGYDGEIEFAAPVATGDADATRYSEKSGIDILEHRDTASLARRSGDKLPVEDQRVARVVDDLLSKFVG